MYESTRELIEALQATPDTLAAVIRDITPEQAQTARGGDENWSIIEVICHLRDTEEHSHHRMQTMRDQDNATISGFDQEALVIERNYARQDLRPSFEAFKKARLNHVTDLAALSPKQWERLGNHVSLGEVSIFSHTLHIVWHDAVHMAQIARQIPVTND